MGDIGGPLTKTQEARKGLSKEESKNLRRLMEAMVIAFERGLEDLEE